MLSDPGRRDQGTQDILWLTQTADAAFNVVGAPTCFDGPIPEDWTLLLGEDTGADAGYWNEMDLL